MDSPALTRPPLLEQAVRAWHKPIDPFMKTVGETWGKPLAELTIPDLLAWGMVFAYAAVTGMVIGHLAGNVLATALRGPARIR